MFQNYITSKYEISHTSKGCGGYHSTILTLLGEGLNRLLACCPILFTNVNKIVINKILTKTLRISAIYFKDVHLLFHADNIDIS
jgi:hypothetical protein